MSTNAHSDYGGLLTLAMRVNSSACSRLSRTAHSPKAQLQGFCDPYDISVGGSAHDDIAKMKQRFEKPAVG